MKIMNILLLFCLFFTSLFVFADAESELQTGVDYYTNKDYKQAAKYFISSTKKGNADAQFYLGQMYRYGNGVPIDYKKAFDWYKKSAEQGNSAAQFFLGDMYRYGEGTFKNTQKSKYWVNEAYNNGCSEDKEFWKKYEL